MTAEAVTCRLAGILCVATLLVACQGERVHLETLRLPPGFSISVYADDIPGARSLAIGDQGTVFVSTRNQGKVHALVDRDGTGVVSHRYTIADGMNMPNGIAFRDGDLFVAEVNRVWRFRDIESRLGSPPEPELVSDAYPDDWHHGWKFIGFGPDGSLYVPIGAPCNVCESEYHARITRLDVESGALEVFAEGVRNTVGFDWHPVTGELWFTDNGRDWLGDDQPPDELNHAPHPGLHFGFPYCHGHDLQDPEFGQGQECSDYIAPAQALGAHVAALGMRFYTGSMFPERYRHRIFIAEHGSWNRTRKAGYRVSMVTLEGDRSVAYEPFIEGWLQPGDSVWGRPVDVLVMPDGALLVSDDLAGIVYRVTHEY